MNEKIKIINPTISHCVEILNYIWTVKRNQKAVTLDGIYNFFAKSRSYSKAAVDFLIIHKVIYMCDNKIEMSISVQAELDGQKNTSMYLIKNRLLNFQPFVDYMILCSEGKKTVEAAKLVKDIYCIVQPVDRVIKIFNDWIKNLHFSVEDFSVRNRSNNTNFDETISKSIKSIAILKDRLGDYYNEIDDNVLSDLKEALTCYDEDPKKAVNDTGRALEDFLRLNFAQGIDTSDCAGIVQIVNLLASQKLISSKQNGVVLGLGNIRSMGTAHGIDKNYTERWTVRKSSALLYIEMVMTTIISLLHFKLDQSLVF